MKSWRNGPRDAGEGRERRVHVREQLCLNLGDRRHLGRRGAQRPEQAVEACAWVGEIASHRLQALEQRVELSDCLVEVASAAGEAGPEAVQGLPYAAAGVRVEGVEQLVDLDGLRCRLLDRDRGARVEARLGGARRELHVLEPQCRARPDDDRGIDRHGLHRLVELEAERHGRVASLGRHRLDLVDEAHARAPDTDLVALHQTDGVGQLRLEVIGRHERKPRIGVVGQEHGDDRHQQRDRAHKDGAGGERLHAGPAGHSSLPRR